MRGPCLGAWMCLSGGLYATAVLADEPPAQSGQGTKFHGTGIFDEGHVNVSFTSSSSRPSCIGTALSKGGLRGNKFPIGTGQCGPMDYVGHEFLSVGAPQRKFKIVSVAPHASIYETCRYAGQPNPPPPVMGTTWEYQVTWSTALTQPQPLCPANNVALAVPLSWTQDAQSGSWRLLPSTSAFTFACVPKHVSGCEFEDGGVIAKCVDWGYPPWTSAAQTLTGQVLSGLTTAGNSLAGNLQEALSFHQTCLRMATADYCGVGHSNTVDGTPIAFHDTKYVPLTAAAHVVTSLSGSAYQGYYFEAAWADCSLDTTGSNPTPACRAIHANPTNGVILPRYAALCLSKRRWASFPFAGTCFDPHSQTLTPFDRDFVPKYCEDYTVEQLEERGARLFTFSRFLDTGLYRFQQDGDPGRAVTTTAYNAPQPLPQHPNLVGINTARLGVPANYVPVRLEGSLLSKTIPQALRAKLQLDGLYRCARVDTTGQKHFLTTLIPDTSVTGAPSDACPAPLGWSLDVPTGGTEVDALEGYLSPVASGFMATPLSLWHDDNNHFITSTTSPGIGWTELQPPLGYIPGNP
ncbi:ADYC domain-containing protein [Myxococcus sp. CA040A]|uniref:ADYC domain-containing protein n=1 Tax=Myxococcus sp. CA040A TaxID=2741738 RepID=UPI001C2DE981|nr:ADYC domain-containing protein [Myxococcus sp. CA040A]NTX06381.1 hypothetical protein [Myxococcus sp. CA040A]